MESTAYRNDLNNLLGDEDNGNMMKRWMAQGVGGVSGMEESNAAIPRQWREERSIRWRDRLLN